MCGTVLCDSRSLVNKERLQREYMSANKQRDTGIDESDEEDHDPALSGAGKAIKKLMNKHEKNEAYESDEESNPYASSVVRFHLLLSLNFEQSPDRFHRKRRRRRNL
jgi:hypothetical protein